jgi:hypothetical protein
MVHSKTYRTWGAPNLLTKDGVATQLDHGSHLRKALRVAVSTAMGSSVLTPTYMPPVGSSEASATAPAGANLCTP